MRSASGADYEGWEDEEEGDTWNKKFPTVATEAKLVLSNVEMANQWSMLNDMRLDMELCDVNFQVHESVFPAHRVVLSCCSRWLKSLLSSNEVREDPHCAANTS